MVQRILTAALFSFAVFALSPSHLWADADGMYSHYSATECKVDVRESTADPADAMYNTRYYDGDTPNLKGITNTGQSGRIKVNCPLPKFDPMEDSVVVTVVDGTAEDAVACRLIACDGGVGEGDAGTTGGCAISQWRSTSASNSADGYTPIVDPGKPENYVSGDLDFITFNYPTEIGTNPLSSFAGELDRLGNPAALSALSHPGLNPIDFSLECSIPSQDADQMKAGINTYGYSYIQSYAVSPMGADGDDDHGH